MRFIGWIALIGAGLGALTFLLTVLAAGSAPQEASGAAYAIALAVIPYCLHGTIMRMKKGVDSGEK